MEAAVMLSGRPGAGTSTLLSALLRRYPKSFRCVTLVTTDRPHPTDAVHPENPAWNEYCYVSHPTFNVWFDRGQFRSPTSEQEGERKVGLLHQTIRNIVEFNGCAVGISSVANFPSFLYMFSEYRRSVTGIFLDVPDDMLMQRLQKQGATECEAQNALWRSSTWREQASSYGYTFIESPDEEGETPLRGIMNFLDVIGWEE